MKDRINLFLALALPLIFSACATKPLKTEGLQNAQWESKALIRDLKANKTQSVNIDVLAVRKDRARFEITALLGFQVASVVMTNNDMAYIIYPQKTFSYGKASEAAFSKLLNLPLHPMNLSNIAFEDPIQGPGWRCFRDVNTGLISSCENKERMLSVEWLERNKGSKKVLIKAPQFEMQWHFDPPQTDVQFKSETFSLKQPNGFKAVQIN